MKVLQITLLVTVFSLMGTLNSFSQNKQRRTPEDMAKQQTSWMKEELKLSAEQEKKVYDINLKTMMNLKAARQKHQGDREAMQAEMKQFRTEKDKALKKTLSEEQYKLYKQRMKELREQRKKKGMM